MRGECSEVIDSRTLALFLGLVSDYIQPGSERDVHTREKNLPGIRGPSGASAIISRTSFLQILLHVDLDCEGPRLGVVTPGNISDASIYNI